MPDMFERWYQRCADRVVRSLVEQPETPRCAEDSPAIRLLQRERDADLCEKEERLMSNVDREKLEKLVEKLRKRVEDVTTKKGLLKGSRPRWCRETDWCREELELALALPAAEAEAPKNTLHEESYTLGREAGHQDCERAAPQPPSDPITFAQHVAYVQRFLIDMYQVMVDPVEEFRGNITELCELLLRRAKEDREVLNTKGAEQMKSERETSDRERAYGLIRWLYSHQFTTGWDATIDHVLTEFAAVRAGQPRLTAEDVQKVAYRLLLPERTREWSEQTAEKFAELANAILDAKQSGDTPQAAWERCANESLKIYLHAFEQNAVVEDTFDAIRRLADAYESPKDE